MPTSSPLHRPVGVLPEAERRARYDAERGPRLYDRRHWRRLRVSYLTRNPLCECGCGYAAEVVDHREPHNGNSEQFFAWTNLQALTKACHDRKTAAIDGGFGNPFKRRL